MNHKSIKYYSKWIFIFLIFLSCKDGVENIYYPEYSDSPLQGKQVYIFGVHPLHNPARLHEIFNPLIEYINENIPEVEFRLEASRNYEEYNKKLYNAHFHFSLPNPYQTYISMKKGYIVFGKMGDDENFRGIFIVRKDSGIKYPGDLKHKAVSFPAPTALAATLLPQYFLHNHGINIMKDIQIKYVGSQESSIMNVYLGNTAAGATWPPPWKAFIKERLELKKELKVIWQTETLPNNGLVVRKDVPQNITNQVAKLLFELNKNKRGKLILDKMELSHFEPASAKTYEPVRIFLEDFNKTVRPLDDL